MRTVIVGGSGLIGRKLVNELRQSGHEAVVASPSSGVNTLTGVGLSEVLKEAQVVVDVSNSPSFEDAAVLHFFETSTRNLLAAEKTAGVGYHVALSVVGADRLKDSGYMRAKVAQEALIAASSIPYTIIRATQFFEFIGAIAGSGADGDSIRLPPAFMQPVAAQDVAATLAATATGEPFNGIIDLAGPDRLRMDELVRRALFKAQDGRKITTDVNARYFGAELQEDSLVPLGDALIGTISLATWLTE